MTNYAKQQILRQRTQAKFPYLIKVFHYIDSGEYQDENGDRYNIYRYANCDDDITFNNELYLASVFSISHSEKNASGISDAKLSISAIDQEWIVKIRGTQKRSGIQFIATIDYDSSSGTHLVEAIEELEYVLTVANWNEKTIQWTMKFDDLQDVNVPLDVIRGSICPALM